MIHVRPLDSRSDAGLSFGRWPLGRTLASRSDAGFTFGRGTFRMGSGAMVKPLRPKSREVVPPRRPELSSALSRHEVIAR